MLYLYQDFRELVLTQASADTVQDACGIRWQPIGVSPRVTAVDWS